MPTLSTSTGQISIDSNGYVTVLTNISVIDDDGTTVLGSIPKTQTFAPGDTLPAGIDASVGAVTVAVWTPAVMSAQQTRVTAQASMAAPGTVNTAAPAVGG